MLSLPHETVGFAANSASARIASHTVACIYSSQHSSARTMMRRRALLLQAGVLQALVMPRQPPIKTALRAAPDMEDLTGESSAAELNMANIEAVGFDMDYTLAQYNEAFDMLAFEGAKDKLVDMGYPAKRSKPLSSTRCSTRVGWS